MLPHQTSLVNLESLNQLAQDWALTHGLVVKARSDTDSDRTIWNACNVTLFPTQVPRSCFELATKLGPHFSKLYHRISQHPTFLEDTLASVIKADPFTKNLLDIYVKCKAEGFKQPLSLGIYRSDYMIEIFEDENTKQKKSNLRQVEVNSIAASFSHLGHLTSQLHRFLIQSRPDVYSKMSVDNQPVNESNLVIPNAIHVAHKEFISQRPNLSLRVVTVMIVQGTERNRIDQRHIEFTLLEKFQVPLIRASLADIFNHSRLNESGDLILKLETGEEVVVSVAYFRAAYTPDDFPSQNEWDARLKLEQSTAIKCPSIAYHLCGTKRVQQKISEPGILEMFFEDEPTTIDLIRTSFAGMYDLKRDGDYQEVHKQALSHPERFVMKPQREGGGSLIVHEDLKDAILNWSDDELSAHALMDRISPFVSPNAFIMEGKLVSSVDVISELGTFHTYLADDRRVLLDDSRGYLLRTKASNTEDGGVASGRAVVDSVYLIDL